MNNETVERTVEIPRRKISNFIIIELLTSAICLVLGIFSFAMLVLPMYFALSNFHNLYLLLLYPIEFIIYPIARRYKRKIINDAYWYSFNSIKQENNR